MELDLPIMRGGNRIFRIAFFVSFSLNIIILFHILRQYRYFIAELETEQIDEQYLDIVNPLDELDNNAMGKLISITNGQETKLPPISSFIDVYLKQKMIFILGTMSSGTTLMRLVLDTHPKVNCGDETRIIEQVLSLITKIRKNPINMKFMSKSGIRNSTIDKATSLFIYYVMENNFKSENISFLNQVSLKNNFIRLKKITKKQFFLI